jgi:hypothetical protein
MAIIVRRRREISSVAKEAWEIEKAEEIKENRERRK